MRTLYRDGIVDTPAEPAATALLVEGERVTWVGASDDAPRADKSVDLAGALVTPAFVDAHLHATDTGLTLLGLDTSGVGSSDELLARVARHAAGLPEGAVVIGHGWDDTNWADPALPSSESLARAAGGRLVYLARVDAHSALVCPKLLASVRFRHPAASADTGWVTGEAHHLARTLALGALSPVARRAAQTATLRRAASLGIAAVHECGGPAISSEEDFCQLLKLATEGGVPEVYGYWGELGAAAKARELGAVGAGGDLFVDGALGSRTAWLREPYHDGADVGESYLTAEQVTDHLLACVRVGLPGGFHAIGDAAIAEVMLGFERTAALVGVERLRAGRHRVEHVELPDRAAIAALVEYGVVASVQPTFDLLWGGVGGMYARRLGERRALRANPLAAMAGVGVPLVFGSDSPVTVLDPWGAVLAAMTHHDPGSRLSARAGFAAHTRSAWRVVGRSDDGVLVPGASATFAVWHLADGLAGALPKLVAEGHDDPDPLRPRCLRTVLRGMTIFEA